MDRSSKEKPSYEEGELVRCNSHHGSGSPKLKAGQVYRVEHIRKDRYLDWMTTIVDSTGDRLGQFFSQRFDPLTMTATTTPPNFKAGDKVRCINAVGSLVQGDIYHAVRVWEEFGSWSIRVQDGSGKIIDRPSGEDWWYARRFENANAPSTSKASGAPQSVETAINDKTCPHCKNDRCSSTERSCWKCGGKL